MAPAGRGVRGERCGEARRAGTARGFFSQRNKVSAFINIGLKNEGAGYCAGDMARRCLECLVSGNAKL